MRKKSELRKSTFKLHDGKFHSGSIRSIQTHNQPFNQNAHVLIEVKSEKSDEVTDQYKESQVDMQ